MSPPAPPPRSFLPTTLQEAGGTPPDVILVTGDAYVDHPAFGAALLGRWLEAHGFRTGILPQPDWRDPAAFRALGAPRLFVGITAGNMDSMVNAWTSARRRRNRDAYSPGGQPDRRPSRATLVYANLVRQALPGVPIILGGLEASCRRFAHYDVWQDGIRGSVLVDAKADLLVYGMAEGVLVEITRLLASGRGLKACRALPGTAWTLGARDPLPDRPHLELPSLEQCRADPAELALATRRAHEQAHRRGAPALVQRHGARTLWVNPPAPALSTADLDRSQTGPFVRAPHPRYRGRPIPAFETTRSSITTHRGCAGGCSFCSLALHQGRDLVHRSPDSVMHEVSLLARAGNIGSAGAGSTGAGSTGAGATWDGVVTDLGGPTANLYGMGCASERARAGCRRRSCLQPRPCRHFRADPEPFRRLLHAVSHHDLVRHAFVSSGLRHDLAVEAPALLRDLARSHLSGRLTVAPEHVAPEVLGAMGKPDVATFERFLSTWRQACRDAGNQPIIVPYFLCAHPGARPESAIALARFLKRHRLRPRQVQLFLPTPGTLSTAMYASGLDPETMEPIPVPKGRKERARHRALALYWKREEHPAVREALRAWGRGDLVGRGPHHLVPPGPIRGGWHRRPGERT